MERRLSFDQLMKFTFKTIGRGIKAYGIVLLLTLGVFLINGAVVIQSLGGFGIFTGVIPVQHKLGMLLSETPTAFVMTYLGLLVVDLLFSLWLGGLLTLIALEADKEAPMSFVNMMRRSIMKMPGMLAYGLIFGVISLVVLLPYLFQTMGLETSLDQGVESFSNQLVASYALLGFGYLVIFVVSVLFIMSYPIYMDNKGGILEGLGEGYRQMKGHFWRTLLYLLVFYLLFFLVAYLALVILIGVSVAVVMTALENSSMLGVLTSWILGVAGLLYVLLSGLSMIVGCNVRVGVYKQLYTDQVIE